MDEETTGAPDGAGEQTPMTPPADGGMAAPAPDANPAFGGDTPEGGDDHDDHDHDHDTDAAPEGDAPAGDDTTPMPQ
jgi:hypothetical protein